MKSEPGARGGLPIISISSVAVFEASVACIRLGQYSVVRFVILFIIIFNFFLVLQWLEFV